MNRWIKQKSFQKDEYKVVACRNCLRIIGETHLGDRDTKVVRCKGCKNKQIIAPPRLGKMNGVSGAFWVDPTDSCFTAFEEQQMI